MKTGRFSFDYDYIEAHKMDLDGTFDFKCRACGKCCKHREDVLLTPYDLFRIARNLGRTPSEILAHYCEHYVGPDSKLPVVRVVPVLRNRRCIVHEDKPVVCAAFPLARVHEADSNCDKPFYVLQPGEMCGTGGRTVTVRSWLGHLSSEESERAGKLMGDLMGALAQALTRDGARHSPQTLHRLSDCLLDTLYLFYDTKEPFLPQFERNTALSVAIAGYLIGLEDVPEWISLPTEAGKQFYARLLLLKAYRLYRLDWCKQRNFKLRDVNLETGAPDGCCFACLDEFTDAEFEDEGYMEYLLPEQDFLLWKELMEDPHRSVHFSGESMGTWLMKAIPVLPRETE